MNKGVTLIELLIVLGMMAVLFSIGALSFGHLLSQSRLDYVSVEVRDALYTARARTLNGSQTSVYFESGKLVVFKGSLFNPSDPENIETALSNGMVFSAVNFPSGIVIFDQATGYPNNFTDPYNVILEETKTGKTRTFSVNKIGIVEVQ